MDEWYYQRGESTFGPISGEMLHGLLKRRRLTESTPVRRADETQWSTAADALPTLPPVQDSPPPAEERPRSRTVNYDSSLPGASEVYAPPQSAIRVARQMRLPFTLWLGVLLVVLVASYKMASHFSMTLIHVSWYHDASKWPEWLQLLAAGLTKELKMEDMFISLMLSIFALVLWQGCAIGSLKSLYGEMVGRSRLSGLWWFVPVANFFMPLFCWRDVRYFSRVRREFRDPHAPFGPLLITWEALWLLQFPATLLFKTGLRSFVRGEGVVDGSQLAMLLAMDLVGMALAVVIALIVLTNLWQQRRLYAHWHDHALWDKHRHD